MFGANASGKSNFVKAIDLGKRLVLEGTPIGSPMEYHPFRLHAENKKKDTTFIYVILCNNKNMNMVLVIMQSEFQENG